MVCETQVCGTVRLMCLENFREFSRKSALGFAVAFLSPPATIGPIGLVRSRSWRACGWGTVPYGDDRGAFGRLRRVGPKDFVLKRCSVETANDRLHFVRCGSFHEREAFRLLRFMIPDDLNRIRYKIFGGEPLFNVVGRDPNRQIA